MAKDTLTAENKAKLIADVRKKLTPDLQPLFDEYCSGKNPQLNKRLQDLETEWEKVLFKWKEGKNKKEGKQEKKKPTLKNPKTIISKIQEEIKKDSFDSLQSAIGYCQNLIKVLEEKKAGKKQDEIDAIRKRMKADKERLKALEEESADKAE